MLLFDLAGLESPRKKKLLPAQVVICAILSHVEVVARPMHDVKEVRKLVDAESIKVGVHKGVGADILQLLLRLVLRDRPKVEEELLSNESRARSHLVEQSHFRGVKREDSVANVAQRAAAFLDKLLPVEACRLRERAKARTRRAHGKESARGGSRRRTYCKGGASTGCRVR